MDETVAVMAAKRILCTGSMSANMAWVSVPKAADGIAQDNAPIKVSGPNTPSLVV
jgi:hypothetical protein